MEISDLRAKVIEAAVQQANATIDAPDADDARDHAEAARALCEGLAMVERGPYEPGLSEPARDALRQLLAHGWGNLVITWTANRERTSEAAARILEELRELCA